MKDINCLNGFEKDFSTRRDFLKTSTLFAGALTIGSLGRSPLAYARDLYPSTKIAFVVQVADTI